MKDHIAQRVTTVANYIVESNATVRNAAKTFGVSKTTIHRDLRERLPKLNIALSEKAILVIDKHIEERSLKGGNATRNRWKHLRGEI